MIVVKITMSVFPEKQKELLQTLFSMIGIVEKEPGCLGYAAFCDIEDKNLLILLEEWQTRKHLDQHFRSDIFGVFLGAKSLLNEPPEFQIYTVNRSEGKEAVYASREQTATTPA